MPKIVFYHRQIDFRQFSGATFVDLCTRHVIDHKVISEAFAINISTYSGRSFRHLYLDRLGKYSVQSLDDAGGELDQSRVLSYETFSRLVVSDNLLEKFWQLEVILELIKSKDASSTNILIDDLNFYNFLQEQRLCSVQAIPNFKIRVQLLFTNLFFLVPVKLFFGLFKSLIHFVGTFRLAKPKIKDEFKIFVGNVFEQKRVHQNGYLEYFFGNYWQNESRSMLILGGNGNYHGSNNRIFVKESLFGLFDVCKCFWFSLKAFYFPLKVLERDPFDALVNYNLKLNSSSSSYFLAFSNYFVYKNLRKLVGEKNGTLVIPHEGRVYERLIQLVFRNNTNVKLTGYAHFALSEKILNMAFGPLEQFLCANFLSFTFGQSNLDFLRTRFGWPIDKVHLGPHLKASRNGAAVEVYSGDTVSLLLLLGMELIPNERLLQVLSSSLENISKPVKVVVRGHPSIKYLDRITELCHKLKFHYSMAGSLSDQVNKCNVVLYGDTGAPIDCLHFNRPLVYIKDDLCLDSDRLTDLGDKHFRAFSSEDLSAILISLVKGGGNIDYSPYLGRFISDIDPATFEFSGT